LSDSFSTNQPNTAALVASATRKFSNISIQPATWDWMTYSSPGRVRLAWGGTGPLRYYDPKRTEVSDDWAKVAVGFAEAEEPLAELRAALENPAAHEFPFPRTNIFVTSGTAFVEIRTAAQWLAGAVLNHLRQGRLEDAAADLRALTGLANLNRQEVWLVHQMIRVAVGGLALSATWQALQAPGWKEEQLASLQRSWETVDLLSAIDRGWIGERAIGEELWQTIRLPGQRRLRGYFTSSSNLTVETIFCEYVRNPIYRLTGAVDEDELFRLRIMQSGVEASRALRGGEPWGKARIPMDARYAELNKINTTIDQYRYWLSLISIPNFQKAFQACLRNEMLRRMTVTAIALKRYELAHGKPPPNLEALVPQFLSAVPIDLMSGHPLRYRLNAHGTFVLYSVGEDGVDDGGDPNPPPGGRPGLWEGKDAVWPSPARPEDEEPKTAEK
jgi:hypothetical protein